MTTTSADDEPLPLTFEQVRDALEVQHGYVHCFANPAPSILVGMDWPIADVLAFVEHHGAELAGTGALNMHHGIGVRGPDGFRFFATRDDWTGPAKPGA